MGTKIVIAKISFSLFVFMLLTSCVSSAEKTPEFDISDVTYNFQKIAINTDSNPYTFTISDIGNGTLKITSIVLSGRDALEFSHTAVAPQSLRPTDTYSFDVTFSPVSVGQKEARITITHNAEGSPFVIDIYGEGYDPSYPNFALSATTFDFGGIVIGKSSSPQKFTISNPGTANLTVSSILLSGTNSNEFALNAVFPLNISGGGSEDIEVTFNPVTIGTKSAAVTFVHNASTSPDTLTLAGEGLTNIVTLFVDDFSSMKGWSAYSDTLHTGTAQWLYFSGGNDTGGSGDFIGADSNYNSTDYFDEYLYSPSVDSSMYSSGTITLEFDGNYQDDVLSANDAAVVAVWDGAGWNVLAVYTTSWNTNGEHVSFDISTYAYGNNDLVIGFYYTGQNNYWFDIDNVTITYKP